MVYEFIQFFFHIMVNNEVLSCIETIYNRDFKAGQACILYHLPRLLHCFIRPI